MRIPVLPLKILAGVIVTLFLIRGAQAWQTEKRRVTTAEDLGMLQAVAEGIGDALKYDLRDEVRSQRYPDAEETQKIIENNRIQAPGFDPVWIEEINRKIDAAQPPPPPPKQEKVVLKPIIFGDAKPTPIKYPEWKPPIKDPDILKWVVMGDPEHYHNPAYIDMTQVTIATFQYENIMELARTGHNAFIPLYQSMNNAEVYWAMYNTAVVHDYDLYIQKNDEMDWDLPDATPEVKNILRNNKSGRDYFPELAKIQGPNSRVAAELEVMQLIQESFERVSPFAYGRSDYAREGSDQFLNALTKLMAEGKVRPLLFYYRPNMDNKTAHRIYDGYDVYHPNPFTGKPSNDPLRGLVEFTYPMFEGKARLALAELYGARMNYPQMMAEAKRALELMPPEEALGFNPEYFIIPHSLMALGHIKQKELDKARQEVDLMRKFLDKADPRALYNNFQFNLAWVNDVEMAWYIAQGEYEKALQVLVPPPRTPGVGKAVPSMTEREIMDWLKKHKPELYYTYKNAGLHDGVGTIGMEWLHGLKDE